MIKIIPYQKKYFSQICSLVIDVFYKYVAKDFTKKGADEYVAFFTGDNDPAKLAIRFDTLAFVALDGSKVVGVVKGRERAGKVGYCNILFVDDRSHGKGVGKKLLLRLEESCKERGMKEIKLKASSHAMPFYQAMGYKKTTGLISRKGIHKKTIQPMKKVLSD